MPLPKRAGVTCAIPAVGICKGACGLTNYPIRGKIGVLENARGSFCFGNDAMCVSPPAVPVFSSRNPPGRLLC